MKPTIHLLLCVLNGFLLILLIYLFTSPNPLSARLHFALFMSVVPALAAWCVARPLNLHGWRVVGLYVGLFVTLQVGLGVASWVG